MFCVIEGIDGAGKTALAADLQGDDRLTVVLKDDLDPAGSFADQRLARMHALTWSYDPTEEVWAYPKRYWAHTLAAWFWMFYDHRLAGPIAAGRVVVTDGWFFKHLARFMVDADGDFAALAAGLFAELPQPDAVVLVDTPVADAQHRLGEAVKPSEAGAFSNPAAPTDRSGFADYQSAVAKMLFALLDGHAAVVVRPADPAGLADQLVTLGAC